MGVAKNRVSLEGDRSPRDTTRNNGIVFSQNRRQKISRRYLRYNDEGDSTPFFAKCLTEVPRSVSQETICTGWSYAPEDRTIHIVCTTVRPWGSKVQRRDCIGSAKEQTSTDTLYLHDFMSNQPALPRANCLFLKPI